MTSPDDRAPRFGVAIDFAPQGRSFREHFRERASLVGLAESLGFHSVWVGESYSSAKGTFHLPTPLLVLAAIAPHTELELGTGVLLLPAWDPRHLAFEAAVLDGMTGGRLMLGVGMGSPALAEYFGHDPAARGAWMDEAIRTLRLAWSDDDARPSLAPVHQHPGGPPILIGGAVGPSAIRAARLGDGYYASTTYPIDLVARQAATYREHLPASAGGGSVGVNRMTLVRTTAQAVQEKRVWLDAALRHYGRMGALGDEWRNVGEGDPVDAIAQDVALVGTPEEVASRVGEYLTIGVDRLQFRVAPGATPLEEAAETLRILAGEVIPRALERAPGDLTARTKRSARAIAAAPHGHTGR